MAIPTPPSLPFACAPSFHISRLSSIMVLILFCTCRLQEETANVESHLLNSEFTKTILSSFSTNKLNSFDSNLLEPLLKLVRLSPSIAASLAVPEMLAGISQRLGHKKPVVRLNLLRLVRIIIDACDPDLGMTTGSATLDSKQLQSLMSTIQRLADKDSAVLVRNLASELVKLRVGLEPFPDVLAAPTVIPNSPVPSSRRPGSGNRRNNSYTPPGLHVSMSVPPTPSHANPRHRPSISTSGGAYIEVAASPRRTPASITHERDAILYRPRSRDGPTGIPRRVSGDVSAAASALSNGSAPSSGSSSIPGKSRLPRTSLSYSRSSLSGGQPPIISRSESALSNKENVSRGSSGSASGSATGSPAPISVIASGKRRNRAPSSDLRWP